jgi:tetrahydromethanopterin S-methyltransferase subunit C
LVQHRLGLLLAQLIALVGCQLIDLGLFFNVVQLANAIQRLVGKGFGTGLFSTKFFLALAALANW